LDSKVAKYLRIVTKNMRTFPGDLLYISKKRGGLGIKKLSDLVNQQKLTLLGRMLRKGGAAGSAMEGW